MWVNMLCIRMANMMSCNTPDYVFLLGSSYDQHVTLVSERSVSHFVFTIVAKYE
jgi:hypothetical protein